MKTNEERSLKLMVFLLLNKPDVAEGQLRNECKKNPNQMSNGVRALQMILLNVHINLNGGSQTIATLTPSLTTRSMPVRPAPAGHTV